LKINKQLAFYFTLICIFVTFKLLYRYADHAHLNFLLKPVSVIIGFAMGFESIYNSEIGYFHPELNIIIDKSCAGFNFWLLSFMLFAFLTSTYFKKSKYLFVCIPIAFFVAYLLTIFSNASRIFVLLVVYNQTKITYPNQQHLFHESVGVVTYLIFLVCTYYFINQFLKYRFLK
jgi:exosortase K